MILPQLLVNGLIAGCALAILALGFGLIYGTLKFFHVGHGAVYVVAGHFLYASCSLLDLPVALSLALTLLASAVLGMILERLIFSPLESKGAPPGVLLLSSLGLSLMMVNGTALLLGSDTKIISIVSRTYQLGPILLTQTQLFQVLGFAVAVPLVLWLLRVTRLGKSFQALSDNPVLLTALGGNVRRIRLAVFALGSLLAGLAASLTTLDVGIDPEAGTMALVNAAVAVIVGSVARLEGAIVGAFTLELARNLFLWQISDRWQSAVTLALLLAFLLLRPEGLLAPRRRLEEQ